MKITLDSISDEAYQLAEATVMGFLREASPSIDIRRGTALRELIVRPMAARYAADALRREELLRSRSLRDMVDNGVTDVTDVDALLSKFNTALLPGRKAVVSAVIAVSRPRPFFIAAGTVLTGASGEFVLLSDVRYNGEGDLFGDPGADGIYRSSPVLLESTDDSDFNPVDVHGEAVELPPGVVVPGLRSITITSVISTARQPEAVGDAMARLPMTLSARGLASRLSLRAALRGPGAPFEAIVRDVSVAGYGDDVVTRARRTPFGVPDGAIDVFVRTFDAPVATTSAVEYVRDGNLGVFVIDPAAAPGFYYVSAVRDTGGSTLGSYPFSVVLGTTDTGTHRGTVPADFARSAFQQAVVSVTLPESHTGLLDVDIVYAPGIADIQAYLDSDTVSGVNSDIVAKAPATVEVRVDVNARGYDDPDGLRRDIAAYVNSISFQPRLHFTDIVSLCSRYGVDVLPGTSGHPLQGSVRGINGTWSTLRGQSLDIRDVCDSANGVHPLSTVFATRESDITLRVNGVELPGAQ